MKKETINLVSEGTLLTDTVLALKENSPKEKECPSCGTVITPNTDPNDFLVHVGDHYGKASTPYYHKASYIEHVVTCPGCENLIIQQNTRLVIGSLVDVYTISWRDFLTDEDTKVLSLFKEALIAQQEMDKLEKEVSAKIEKGNPYSEGSTGCDFYRAFQESAMITMHPDFKDKYAYFKHQKDKALEEISKTKSYIKVATELNGMAKSCNKEYTGW